MPEPPKLTAVSGTKVAGASITILLLINSSFPESGVFPLCSEQSGTV
jgi:hypothetical protein